MPPQRPTFLDLTDAQELTYVDETGRTVGSEQPPAKQLHIGNFVPNAIPGYERLNLSGAEILDDDGIKRISGTAISCETQPDGSYLAKVIREKQGVVWNGVPRELGDTFQLREGILVVRGLAIAVLAPKDGQGADSAGSDSNLGLSRSEGVNSLAASRAVRKKSAEGTENPWDIWRKIMKIAGQGLPLQEVLDRIGPLVASLVPSLRGLAILSREAENKPFAPPQYFPLHSGDKPASMPTSRTLAQEALTSNQALLFTPTASDASLVASIVEINRENRALVVAPIDANTVLQATADTFTSDDLEQLAAIAMHLQRAIRQNSEHSSHAELQEIVHALERAGTTLRKRMFSELPSVPGVHIATAFDPRFHLGGDVVCRSVNSDGELSVFVGDVAGHDAHATMQATFLLAAARADAGTSLPGALLETLNKESQVSDELLMATGCAIRLDPKTGKLTLANAGHPYPFVVRGGEVLSFGETAKIAGCEMLSDEDPSACALGVTETEYENVTVQLENGDCLLIVTDGVLEHLSTDGQQFGFQGVKEALLAAHARGASTPEEYIDGLKTALGKHADYEKREDDVTIFGLGYDQSGAVV